MYVYVYIYITLYIYIYNIICMHTYIHVLYTQERGVYQYSTSVTQENRTIIIIRHEVYFSTEQCWHIELYVSTIPCVYICVYNTHTHTHLSFSRARSLSLFLYSHLPRTCASNIPRRGGRRGQRVRCAGRRVTRAL